MFIFTFIDIASLTMVFDRPKYWKKRAFCKDMFCTPSVLYDSITLKVVMYFILIYIVYFFQPIFF